MGPYDPYTNRGIKSLADYVDGMASVYASLGSNKATEKLKAAAEWLDRLATKTCGRGIIGCSGGPDCDLDHK